MATQETETLLDDDPAAEVEAPRLSIFDLAPGLQPKAGRQPKGQSVFDVVPLDRLSLPPGETDSPGRRPGDMDIGVPPSVHAAWQAFEQASGGKPSLFDLARDQIVAGPEASTGAAAPTGSPIQVTPGLDQPDAAYRTELATGLQAQREADAQRRAAAEEVAGLTWEDRAEIQRGERTVTLGPGLASVPPASRLTFTRREDVPYRPPTLEGKRLARSVVTGVVSSLGALGAGAESLARQMGIDSVVWRDFRLAMEEVADKTAIDDPSFPEKAVQVLGSSAAFIGPAMAARVMGAAPGLAVIYETLLEAMAEQGDAYQQALAEGRTPTEAIRTGNKVALGNALLLAITNRFSPVRGLRGGPARRVGTGIVSEAAEEGMQLPIQETAAGRQAAPGRIGEATALGAVGGGVMSGVLGAGQDIQVARARAEAEAAAGPQPTPWAPPTVPGATPEVSMGVVATGTGVQPAGPPTAPPAGQPVAGTALLYELARKATDTQLQLVAQSQDATIRAVAQQVLAERAAAAGAVPEAAPAPPSPAVPQGPVPEGEPLAPGPPVAPGAAQEPSASAAPAEAPPATLQELETAGVGVPGLEPLRPAGALPAPASEAAPVAKPAGAIRFGGGLFQGRGKTPEEIYGTENVKAGMGVPLLGPADYYAFTSADAARYGEVTPAPDVRLERARLLTTNKDWFDLLAEAGTPHLSSVSPLRVKEPGQIPAMTLKLQQYLRDQGYDGLVVKMRGDQKRLRESFGHDQVIVFRQEAPAGPEIAPPAPASVAPPAAEPRGGQKFTAVSSQVRDHPQQAVIQGDAISIISRVGNKVAGRVEIPFAEWVAAEHQPTANVTWNRRALIGRHTAGLDDQPGGPEQAERIRDAMIEAIQRAAIKRLTAPVASEAEPAAPAAPTTYPDGRQVPVVGARVYTETVGPSGTPARLVGEVVESRGQRKVRLVEAETEQGSVTLSAKTYTLTPKWTAVDDPEMLRREGLKDDLAGMRIAVNVGTPGRRLFNPDTSAFIGVQPSTYPPWMTKIAPTQKEALRAIDDALTGKPTAAARRAADVAEQLKDAGFLEGDSPTWLVNAAVITPDGPGLVRDRGPTPGTTLVMVLEDFSLRVFEDGVLLPDASVLFDPQQFLESPISEMRREEFGQRIRDLEVQEDPLRYEKTPEGEQALVPGAERREIPAGPIRKPMTKPHLESTASERNLFNMEAWDEEAKRAASRGDLFSEMRVQGPAGTVRAVASMDPRLLQVLGGNLYSGDLGQIAVKEMIQNAVDSIRALDQPMGGKLEIEVDPLLRKITVTDTGAGMTPEVATKELVDIGGSQKVEGASGGFGIAKVAIFANAESIHVETTARRPTGQTVTTTVTGSAEDWLNPAKGLAVEIQERSGKPTGTTIEVRLKPEAKFNGWEAQAWLQAFLDHSLLPIPIRVQYRGAPMLPQRQAMQPSRTVAAPGAAIDFTASTTRSLTDTVFVRVLNQGLYQFTHGVWAREKVSLPETLTADVRATASPESSSYPFRPDRQGLRAEAEAAVTDYVVKQLVQDAVNREMATIKKALATAPSLAGTSHKVYDTTQTLPQSLVETLAQDRALANLSLELESTFARIESALQAVGEDIQAPTKGYYGGIGLGDGYWAVNIAMGKVLPGQPNLILVNPYRTIQQVMQKLHSLNAPDALARGPGEVSKQLVLGVLHEIAHQHARGHDEVFAGVETRFAGTSLLALAESAGRVEQVLRQPVVATPAQPSLFDDAPKETTLEHFQRTLTNHLLPEWNKSRDVFGDLSVQYAGESVGGGPGDRPGALGAGAGRGDRPLAALPGSGGGPAGPVAPGAPVGGRGAADVVAERRRPAALGRATQLHFEYAKRPDAGPADDILAKQAYADTERVPLATPESDRAIGRVESARGIAGAAGSRILALGIRALPATGRIDLRGLFVRTAGDLAQLAQIYRDARYETLRIIYMAGTRIVAHEGLSSRLPSAAVAFVHPENVLKSATEMTLRMARLGANGYYLLHNHPSGNPRPSDDDLKATRAYAARVPGFRGHVIIDHESYGRIGPGLDVTEHAWVKGAPPGTPDPLRQPAVPHPALGTEIKNAEEAVLFGKALGVRAGWVTVVWTTNRNLVQAITEVPEPLFQSATFGDVLRGQGRAFGSDRPIAIFEGKDPHVAFAAGLLLSKKRILDAIWLPSGLSLGSTGVVDTTMGRPMRARLVREDAARYATDPHYLAVRDALASGQMTPERAEALGHFKTYPSLRPPPAPIPPSPPKPGHAAEAVTRDNLAKVQARRQAEQEITAGGQLGALGLPIRFGFGRTPPSGTPPTPPSPNAAVERVATATGKDPLHRSLLQWMREFGRDVFVYEPLLKAFPMDQELMRRFEGMPRRVSAGARDDVVGVLGVVPDVHALDLFQRIAVFRDLAFVAGHPERFAGGVPGDLTLPEILAELARLQPMVTEPVSAALAAHDRLVTAEFDDLVARHLKSPGDRIEHYYPHHVLDRQPDPPLGGQPGRPKRATEPFRPYTVRRQGSSLLIETDYIRAMYQHRAKVRLDNAIDDFALAMLERHDVMADLLRPAEAQLQFGELEARRGQIQPGGVQPGDLVMHEGQRYRGYQYKPGRQLFAAHSVQEWDLRAAIEQAETELFGDLLGDTIEVAGVRVPRARPRPLSIMPESIRKILAVGGLNRVYVVPEAIAERFKNFGPQATIAGMRQLNAATRGWKSLTIAFGGTAWNVMNLEGDLLNFLRQAPEVAGPGVAVGAAIGGLALGPPGAVVGAQAGLLLNPYLWRALGEIIAWKRGTGSDLSVLMTQLEEADVIGSGFVGTETALRETTPELTQFLAGFAKMRAQGRQGVRFLLREIPEIREAVPRVAMAMYQLKRVAAGLPIKGRGIDIHGLDPTAAALRIAREFPVDYGRRTPVERQVFSGLLFPFAAWAQGNSTNWARAAMAAPATVLGFLGVRFLLELWNNLDEERREFERGLPPYKRAVPHVITGWKDKDGKMIVTYLAGDPLSDAMGWIGLGQTPNRISDLLTERIAPSKAVREQLEAFGREPGAKVTGLLNPVGKVLVEGATGHKSLSGAPIVPRALRGTDEEFRRLAMNVLESFVRPIRESRLLWEQAQQAEGIDPLSWRYGLGLPFERVDPGSSTIRGGMDAYEAAVTAYVQAVIAGVRESESYAAMNPTERELVLVRRAELARRAFIQRYPPPLSGKQRFGHRMGQAE